MVKYNLCDSRPCALPHCRGFSMLSMPPRDLRQLHWCIDIMLDVEDDQKKSREMKGKRKLSKKEGGPEVE